MNDEMVNENRATLGATRRTVLAGISATGLAALLGASARTASAAVTTGGIGLRRDEWEAVHGAGVPGQAQVTYEDERYYVGFTNGLVTFIETGWEDRNGINLQNASQAVRALLPSDVELVETISFPATPAGPVALLALRYERAALPDLIGDLTGPDPTATIVALYQLLADGGTGPGGPLLARVSIALGLAG